MVLHNELVIARREQLENHIYSQISIEGRTKSLQALNVTNHLDHMRTNSVSLHANKELDTFYLSALA